MSRASNSRTAQRRAGSGKKPKSPEDEIFKDPKRYEEFCNNLSDKLERDKLTFDEFAFVFFNTKRPLEPIISLQTSTEELFYGSYDGPIRCFSSATGKRTQTLRGHNSWITDLELIKKSKVFDVLEKDIDNLLKEEEANTKLDGNQELESRKELILFSSSKDGDIKCWELTRGKAIKSFSNPENKPVTCMKVCTLPQSNKKPFCAGGSTDGSVTLWDLETNDIKQIFTGHASTVSCLDFNESKLFSGSWDSFVKMVDLEKDDAVTVLRPSNSPIKSVAANNNDLFAGCGNGMIYHLDLRTNQVVATFRGHTEGVLCLRIYDEGHLLSSSDDSSVVLWDVKTKELLHAYCGHKDAAPSISITEDDKTVYSGGLDKTIRRWAVEPKIKIVEQERTLQDHKKKLEELYKSIKPANTGGRRRGDTRPTSNRSNRSNR
ncbi:hypothetical protein ABK040_013715 [Willaertia magna]